MSAETSPDVTRALVRVARAIEFDSIPHDAVTAASHCLLDYVACTLAGASEPLSDILVSQVVAGEDCDAATLIGRRERATVGSAALFNGAAGHALDYDDTHAAMGGHPSVPVVPALLALAEARGSSGRDLITALVAGFELQARLGRVIGDGHYAAGFHTTGTVGTFGAAAACARLLELDEDAFCHALGVAGTQAAGLKSGFGTMAKPLHAGGAAAAGLLAAQLASGGFIANPGVVEAVQGFASTHAGREPSLEAIENAAGRWTVCDTLFKYHAACYLTHASIETIAELKHAHGIAPEDVQAIEIEVHPSLFGVCHIPEPKTGLEGKFSLRATAAMSLLGLATHDPATFSEDTVNDPNLVAIRDRVTVNADKSKTGTQAHVRIQTSSGSFEGERDTGIPARDLAAQGKKLREKFDRLARPVVGAERAEALANHILRVGELDSAKTLMALVTPVA